MLGTCSCQSVAIAVCIFAIDDQYIKGNDVESYARCGRRGDSRLTPKHDDTVSEVGRHNKVVFDYERRLFRMEDKSEGVACQL